MWRSLFRTPNAIHARLLLGISSVLLAPALGLSQSVSFGLIVGTPLCPLATATGTFTATTAWYTVGPSLRVGLPHAFGLDADLLYKRFDFGSASAPGDAAVHRLELQLLLRYEFRRFPLHPWLHTGMSFNRVVAVEGADLCAQSILGEKVYCLGEKRVADLRHQHTYGLVLGAGVRFDTGRVQLSPELRITRWVDRNFGTRDSPLRSNLTQVELLLGITF